MNYRTYYQHFRLYRDGMIQARGGGTLSLSLEQTEDYYELSFGQAFCSLQDNYCKKTGRMIADGRRRGRTQHHRQRYTNEGDALKGMEKLIHSFHDTLTWRFDPKGYAVIEFPSHPRGHMVGRRFTPMTKSPFRLLEPEQAKQLLEKGMLDIKNNLRADQLKALQSRVQVVDPDALAQRVRDDELTFDDIEYLAATDGDPAEQPGGLPVTQEEIDEQVDEVFTHPDVPFHIDPPGKVIITAPEPTEEDVAYVQSLERRASIVNVGGRNLTVLKPVPEGVPMALRGDPGSYRKTREEIQPEEIPTPHQVLGALLGSMDIRQDLSDLPGTEEPRCGFPITSLLPGRTCGRPRGHRGGCMLNEKVTSVPEPDSFPVSSPGSSPDASGSQPLTASEHVCGLQGFGLHDGDRCGACEKERGASEHRQRQLAWKAEVDEARSRPLHLRCGDHVPGHHAGTCNLAKGHRGYCRDI